MGHFTGLSSTELRTLADALRSGRLNFPVSRLALQRFNLGIRLDATLGGMQHLAELKASPQSLALTLDMLAEERVAHTSSQDSVDLVWSGPESPVAPSRDTGSVVRELFRNAHHSVLVAGYAVHKGKDVFRELAERMEEVPELRVEMYLNVQREYGDTTISSMLVQRFLQDFRRKNWSGKRLPELYYDPRALEMKAKERACLHAKCVVVDKSVAFISSANFTPAAQKRNIEVGVTIASPALAERLALHFSALKESGEFKTALSVP